MFQADASRAVTLVSSQRIRSAACIVLIARAVMSPRLPIGVETSTRPSGGGDAPGAAGEKAYGSSDIRAPRRDTSTAGLCRRTWAGAAGGVVARPPRGGGPGVQ